MQRQMLQQGISSFAQGINHLHQSLSLTLTFSSCLLSSSHHPCHVFPDLRARLTFFLVPERQVW